MSIKKGKTCVVKKTNQNKKNEDAFELQDSDFFDVLVDNEPMREMKKD